MYYHWRKLIIREKYRDYNWNATSNRTFEAKRREGQSFHAREEHGHAIRQHEYVFLKTGF
jgi:hypothetical protein